MAPHTPSAPRETEWQAWGHLCLPGPGLGLANGPGGWSPPGTSMGPCARSAPKQQQLKKAEALNGISETPSSVTRVTPVVSGMFLKSLSLHH